MKYFIAISGNMGAGKTMLAKRLESFLGWERYTEPFLENQYLEKFYKDMKRWAFPTEMTFLKDRLANHLQILRKDHSVIQDRCVYEGAEVFVRNLYLNKQLQEKEWQGYRKIYEEISRTIKPPDLILYRRSTPERCLHYIQKRDRGFEKTLGLEYLQNLHKLYEGWLLNFKLCPVLVIESDNYDYKTDDEALRRLVLNIMNILRKKAIDK